MPEVGKVWTDRDQECIVVAWEEATTYNYAGGGVHPALVILQSEHLCEHTGRLTRDEMDWLSIEVEHLPKLLRLVEQAAILAEASNEEARAEVATKEGADGESQ